MHLMLVHVNNHDDRLVPEREERGGILSQTGGQILSEILPKEPFTCYLH